MAANKPFRKSNKPTQRLMGKAILFVGTLKDVDAFTCNLRDNYICRLKGD